MKQDHRSVASWRDSTTSLLDHASSGEGRPSTGARRAALGSRVPLANIIALVPVVILAVLGYQRRWMADDAFIDLRVVRNILAGYGPVYNVGERVEAYTNPLWVALLTAWGRFGGRLEIGAVALGLAFTLIGLLAGQAGASVLARRLHRSAAPQAPGLSLPLGALVLAVLPAMWDFTTSGLETGLTFSWLGTAFWLLTRSLDATASSPPHMVSPAVSRRWSSMTALFLGLGPLIRPDLAVFSAGFLTALILGYALTPGPPRKLAGGIRLVLVTAALPVLYEAFRMGYFAALVPNTAVAKEAGAAYWSQGWRYLADFVLAYLLVIPLVPLLGWWFAKVWQVWRRHEWNTAAALLAPVLAALAHAGYVVRAGGDFMHGRLLLPSLFGLLLPVATVILPLDKGDARRCRIAFAVGLPLIIWAICCALWLRVPYAGAIGSWGIADERGFYVAEAGNRHPITLDDYAALDSARDGQTLRDLLSSPPKGARDGRWLQLDNLPGCATSATAPPTAGCGGVPLPDQTFPLAPTVPSAVDLVVARKYIGVIGYLLGPRVHVVDRLGLSDPIAAHLQLTARGRPGHEKLLPQDWILARFGDTGEISPLPEEAVAARDALSCGDLSTLQRAVDEPLTVGRFLENIRLSFRLYHLRIPADPLAARAAFCNPR